MASKSSANDFENHAPEVVERSSDLIPAQNSMQHDMQYPQVVQQDTASKAYSSYHPTSNQTPDTSYSSHSEGYYPQEKESITYGEAGVGATDAAKSKRRKRWIWIIAGISLILLAVGLGAGLGVGLSLSDDNKDAASDQSQSTSVPTTTTAAATTSTSSTPAAVTSGTTGVAAFSCGSQQPTESTDGTEFIQECYTQYTTNQASYYYATDNVTTQNLGGKYTTYNLTACLDSCDDYNSQGGSPPCRAVTYYANLSAPIQMWGANCFLKNDRGTDAHADANVDWTNTLSAFMSCLNETCHGQNTG